MYAVRDYNMYYRYAPRNFCTAGAIFCSEEEKVMGKSLQERLIELRESTGMNRKSFAEYFGIPYRTMTDWERGERQMPEYLLRLMAYKVKVEMLSKEGKENKGETINE